MRILDTYSKKMHQWTHHPNAIWILGFVSFIESFFFPCPPDVMLIPMCFSRPAFAIRFAWVTTVASVLGGLFGYLLGYCFIEWIYPYLIMWGYGSAFLEVKEWFSRWGFFAVIVAGITPIPYKLFTIAGGAMHVNIFSFILASFLGRGFRFFAEAVTISYGGKRIEVFFRNRVEKLGWCVVLALAAGVFLFYFLYR